MACHFESATSVAVASPDVASSVASAGGSGPAGTAVAGSAAAALQIDPLGFGSLLHWATRKNEATVSPKRRNRGHQEVQRIQ